METKTKIIKEFDTVKTFREIKDKISKDIKGMTFEQLQAYLDKTKLKSKTASAYQDDGSRHPTRSLDQKWAST